MILKKVLKNVAIGLSFLMAAQFTFANAPLTKASAAATTVSYVAPATVAANTTFDVSVNVSDVTNLYGVGIDFLYDSTLISVESATPGAFMTGTLETVKDLQPGNTEYALHFQGTATSGKTGSGTVATFKVKFLKAGTLDIAKALNVKLSTEASAVISYTETAKSVSTTIAPVETSKIVSFKADKASGQKVGTAINFTVTSDPSTNTNYAFYVREGVGAWTNMQTWSSKNTFTWTPTTSGVYRVRAFVKNVNSTAVNDGYQDILFVVKDNVATPVVSKLTSFTANPTTGAVNKATTFTAAAIPASKALYSFYVKAPGSTTWERIQDYSFKTNFTYTPTKAGVYQVRVHCWNINSNNASTDGYLDLAYTVK